MKEMIVFASGEKICVCAQGRDDEFTAGAIEKYRSNLKTIQRRREWKTSGVGALFMGMHQPQSNPDEISASINGIAACDGEIVYSAALTTLGGIYRRKVTAAAEEGLVFSHDPMLIGRISVHGGSCAASIGTPDERHIAVFDIERGHYRELTEGDVVEDYPAFSPDGRFIYFSSAGTAVNAQGQREFGPFCIMRFHIETGALDEVEANENYSYIVPRTDEAGALYYIRRPYKQQKQSGITGKDVLLFPVRLIKAIGGMLNYFSIIFGGESLHSGKSAGNEKARQKSGSELFIDGNVIHAEQTQTENERRGEKFPGIIPYSWELVRSEGGKSTTLKKGVMDYTFCGGDIVYSNGQAVIRLAADGSEELLAKRRLAGSLTVIESAHED